jgi:hypothetical protein
VYATVGHVQFDGGKSLRIDYICRRDLNVRLLPCHNSYSSSHFFSFF